MEALWRNDRWKGPNLFENAERWELEFLNMTCVL